VASSTCCAASVTAPPAAAGLQFQLDGGHAHRRSGEATTTRDGEDTTFRSQRPEQAQHDEGRRALGNPELAQRAPAGSAGSRAGSRYDRKDERLGEVRCRAPPG
jgi:hypothetical protein